MPRMFVTLFALLALAAAAPAAASPPHCPPGLAKRNPPCVPPGQARKGVTTAEWLNRGDVLGRGHERLRDPWRYRLPVLGENEGWYRDGRIVYRVDETTRRVIDWILLTEEIFGN